MIGTGIALVVTLDTQTGQISHRMNPNLVWAKSKCSLADDAHLLASRLRGNMISVRGWSKGSIGNALDSKSLEMRFHESQLNSLKIPVPNLPRIRDLGSLGDLAYSGSLSSPFKVHH